MKKLILFCCIVIGLILFVPKVSACTVGGAKIDSFSPTEIMPGETEVTIVGSGFQDDIQDSKVYFDSYTAGTIISWSNNQISVRAPSPLYLGKFRVSICCGWQCQATAFYDIALKPKITSLSANSVMPGEKLYIQGDNFGSNQGSVYINGQQISITNWSLISATVIVPSLGVGNVNVEVKTSNGIKSNPVSLVIIGNPIIDSITPKEITPGETLITITGSNFGSDFNSGTLYISGSSLFDSSWVAITKASWSSNSISFIAPVETIAGRVKVRIYKGYPNYTDFTYSDYFNIKPTITSYSNTSGKEGDEVTIYGSNFKNNNFGTDRSITYYPEVYFNGVKASVLDWQNNYIKVKAPNGATTGTITVKIKTDELNSEVSTMGKIFEILQGVASDDLSAYQKYLQRVKIKDAWSYSTGSSNVIVAVIDSGIYINHPDLVGNIWKNTREIEGNGKDDDKNGYIDDIYGWNFVDDNNWMDITFDKDDHGTMVAGIIGAKHDNGIGISGINKNIRLMPLLILSKYKSADNTKVSKAIRYAVDNGASIINLSFGTRGTVGYTTDFDDAIKYAFEHNILIIAAAGNGDVETGLGQDLSFIKESPVCNDGDRNMILGVGALSDTDEMRRTNWSNYSTSVNYVDVWAPGENILTTSKPEYSNYQNYYYYGDGTSFAAPIVTGIAALIKARHPEITNTALRDRIIRSAGNNFIVNAYEAISQPLSDFEKVKGGEKVLIKGISISNINSFINEEKKLIVKVDKNLSNKLKGRILLQVENHGEAWYINPKNSKKYYMANGNEAYNIMRYLGIGITNKDLVRVMADKTFAKKHSGKIFLKVEANGEAYYLDTDGNAHYLKDGSKAYNIMRDLGLGITNNNLRKIDIDEI